VAEEAARVIQVTMRPRCFAVAVLLSLIPPIVARAQQRGAPPPPAPQAPGTPAQPGSGRGRGGISVMTLASSAWPDGGTIPDRFTQAGDDVSPPLSWSNVPVGTVSFVLIVHDADAAVASGTDDTLHWMLWNIPATVTALHERAPSMAQLPDGTRQISATGPYYRGPGAAAAGPAHHYVFELYALDTMVDVPAVGASPAQTRGSVLQGMAGHVRGKAVYVGLFKRHE
jgi:Raf kinase inhibitor-like YbhB/YbcL family protein